MLGLLRAFVLDAVATELASALQTGALLKLTPIASGLQISLEAWSEDFPHLTQILFGPSKLPCNLFAPIPRAPPQRQLPPGQSYYTTPITGSVASSEVTLPRLAAFNGLQLHRAVAENQTYHLKMHYVWGPFTVRRQAAAELFADLFSLRGPLRLTDYDSVAW